MNNKGFAITTILFGILILFMMLLVSMLGMLSTYKDRLSILIENTNGTRDIINRELRCTIKYDLNGGTGDIQNQSDLCGSDIKITDIKPSNKGNLFIGWNTDKNSTIKQYSSNESFKLYENLTLYAIWIKTSIPIFTYTGNYQIVDDNDNVIQDTTTWTGNWKIRFLTDGDLVFKELNGAAEGIDIFLVGGGGNGATGSEYYGLQSRGGGGGGGGAAITVLNFPTEEKITYGIDIGSSRNNTSFSKDNTTYYTALAGKNAGAPSYSGGWNVPKGTGGNGRLSGQTDTYGADQVIVKKGGNGGQNGNYEFNEASGKRYGAGGGGGGGGDSTGTGSGRSNGGSGGNDGGGKGGGGCDYKYNQNYGWQVNTGGKGSNGSTNTGSGGGGGGGACGSGDWSAGGNNSGGSGGTGIVIIRNKR